MNPENGLTYSTSNKRAKLNNIKLFKDAINS